MASTRAQEVAEILWELKRADKVATFSAIAGRAGFSAGTKGRTMILCLRTVRRDWPHLQWWRAIKDDGLIQEDSEHAAKLSESGIEFEPAAGNEELVAVSGLDDHLMNWEDADKNESPEQSEGS